MVRLGWVHLKWKNVKNGVEMMSLAENEYWQISSNFGQHALKVRLGWEHLKWKNVKNGVEMMSFGQNMSIVKFHPVLANMLLTLLIPSHWLK